MMSDAPKLITTGLMAANLGVSVARVLHVLRTRQHIRPSAVAGNVRLYSKRQVAMVRHELNATDARRDYGNTECEVVTT